MSLLTTAMSVDFIAQITHLEVTDVDSDMYVTAKFHKLDASLISD